MRNRLRGAVAPGDGGARVDTTEDGRLFRSPRTNEPINAEIYTTAWDMARKIGFSPAQYLSPLAADPYDLRRAAVSTWLAAGQTAPGAPAPGAIFVP